MLQIVIAVIVTLIVAVPVTMAIANAYHQKVSDQKVGNAEERARAIIDEAVKNAETKKREALLEAKEESLRTKNELDKEIRERRAEIQRNEHRIMQKEENLTRSWKRWRRRKLGLLPGKRRSTSRRLKLRS